MSIIDRLFVQILTATQSQNSEEGQGMAEYALILALIAVICAAAFTGVAGKITSVMNGVVAAL